MEGSRIIFNARNSTTGLLLTTIRIHFTNYMIPAVGFPTTLSWDMCKLVVDISKDSCVYTHPRTKWLETPLQVSYNW